MGSLPFAHWRWERDFLCQPFSVEPSATTVSVLCNVVALEKSLSTTLLLRLRLFFTLFLFYHDAPICQYLDNYSASR
jgi:hypothetical protein